MNDTTLERSVVYPDSDGLPMADNTLQWAMIVLIKVGLDLAFRARDDVFVAGDLLWYYAEGDPTQRIAPDVMVAIGRPPSNRSSYRQWEEGGIAPQLVVEFLSPSNTAAEMVRKRAIYASLGVQEYLEIEPELEQLRVWHRVGEELVEQRVGATWTSARLGLSIDTRHGLAFRVGDGPVFQAPSEWIAHEQARANEERRLKDEERRRTAELEGRLEAERLRADELQRRLDELQRRADVSRNPQR